jgi:drug/metabolite transporter (DMT)-like permease
VSRRHVAMLLALGSIWGAAFMLIEIGLRDFPPAALVTLRLGSAALTLALLVAARRRLREMVARMRPFAGRLALAALVNNAVPFVLIAWGQQYVTSSVAAILNASAPLFTVLLAAIAVHSQRVTGWRLLGFVVGFGGVVLAVGGEPGGGTRAIVGGLAVVAAGVCYAAGALYVGGRLRALSPLEVSLGLLVFATLFTLPAGLAELPDAVGWKPLAAVLALGVVATALAFQLYFGLIAGAGASRAILVTYLVPSLAVVYGVVLLDEHLTGLAIGGLVLVLLGVTLGTGARLASNA